MSYVGKIVDTDGSTGLVGSTLYGTCATAADTVAKVGTLADFDTLIEGVTVHIKFTYSNTATDPTLNINGTGAKRIYKNGTTSVGKTVATSWAAGSVVSLTYDGTAWQMNDHTDNTNTTYSAGTGLTLSSTTFNHSNSVTAGTAKGDDSKTLTFGGTFTIPTVTYDAQGHITGKGTTTMTMPANPDTDAKVTQSSSTTSDFRPLLLGKNNQTNPENLETTVTDQTYVTKHVFVQPSTGNLTLYNASGDSPSLIFRRGTMIDSTLEWRIQNVGGKLNFDRDKNESTETWENILQLDPTNSKMYFKNTEVSLSGHTHNYAGSSSAGGAANSANVLNYNNSVTATTSGLQYTHGSMTIGSADGNAKEGSNASYKLWSYPAGGTATNSTSANIQNLRLYWSSAYFRDIFLSPNNDRIYHRAVINNSAKPWYVLLDSNNLETYSLHTPDTAKALSTDTAHSMSPITRPQNLYNRSNKLALIPGSNITVEYSTDAGSNWTDMGLTADKKGDLFNDTISATIPIGPNDSTDRTTSMQTRITITCDGRDQMIDQYILWLDSAYQTISIDLQVAYGNATTTFTNIRTGLSCPPWIYQYILNTETKRFGPNTTSDYVNKIRFIIKYTSINSSYKTSRAIIHSIAGYSGIYWGGAAKNNLMIYDHLYTWDNSQNATFPAQLNATGATFTSSSFGPLKIVRSGSTNAASIKFYNNTSTYLGSLGINTANSRFLRWDTNDSTSYEIIDRSVVSSTPSAKVNTNWNTTTDRTTVVTKGWMSFWDGAYNGSTSNLTYCNQGAFGTIVTKSATDYSKVSISRNLTSGTKVGTITIDGTATDLYCQTNTDTDTKVNVTLGTTTKAYLLGTTTTPTSTATGVTSVADTGVYLGTAAGSLIASSIYGSGAESQSTAPTGGYRIYDCRSVNVSPNDGDKAVNFYFHMADMPDTSLWWSVLHMRGWTGGYSAWEIAGPSDSKDQRTKPLYVRTSNTNTAWGSWRKIYDTSNPPTASEVGALASTTKYAGSSSVGGAATSANILNKNNTAGATTTGVQYANGQLTIGTADGNAVEGSNGSYKLWSYPTGGTAVGGGTANIQNLRLYWSSTWFRDIFISPNNYDIYHRSVAAGTAQPWRKILDSGNYTSYALPRNIKHIHTASGTEGSAGWVKIARITVTNLYANHPMTFTIAQRGLMQYRIHLVLVNNGSVAAAAISQFIIARDNSWTDTDNNPRAYIIKPSDGIFDLYIRKTEAYDHIFVVDFTKADGSEGDNYSVTWTNVHAADSEITGGTEAVKKLYLLTSGGTMTGELKQQLQLRIYSGNYGTIFRIDGTNTYFLLTESGSAESGSWNSLRPLYFSNSTGKVTMENGLTVYNGITGDLTGNVTGNCSGSSGSCTGNSATSTKATQDGDGNTISSTYLKLSGGTMTGQLKTSFKESVAVGSYQAQATKIPDLCTELRYSSGAMGSVSLTEAYTKDGITIAATWYNFIWIPHRSGGVNGAASGDNCNYGSLILSGMTGSGAFIIRYATGSIAELKYLYKDTTYSANNGVGLSGTTFYNSGVRSTTLNGNYLRVNTNGTNADLTIPYATKSSSVSSSGTRSSWWNDRNNSVVQITTGDIDYRPLWSLLTATSGSWAMGNHTGDDLVFNFTSKAVYDTGTNPSTNVQIHFTNGGAITASGLTLTNSGYGPLKIVRSDQYYAGIKFYNNTSTYLGSIAINAANNRFVRLKTDESTSYTILDTSLLNVTEAVNLGLDGGTNAFGYVSGLTKAAWNFQQTDGTIIRQYYNTSWKSEIYMDYRTGQMSTRGKNNGTWQDWRIHLDSGNYTSYTVTKTGGGASGTWGINITGNAATATKATQDGDGNTISSTYLKLSGGTMTGTITHPANTVAINLRADGTSTWQNTIMTQSAGDEAVVFANANARTSWMFVNGEDSIAHPENNRWQSLTPALQIKGGCVAIGKLIPSGTTPTTRLDIAGSTALTGDIQLKTSGSSSDDSGDIVWYYGNGLEKARLWQDNTYTEKTGPQYRVYKSDGTNLYSGRLPLADGTSASGTWGISITGSAASAAKLETARNIALGEDFAGGANFDGSGNISISGTFYKCSAFSDNTANYPWHRIAYRTGVTGVYNDTDAIFMIRACYNGGPFGIIKVTMRTNGSGTNCQVAARWLVRQNIAVNDVYIAQWGKTGQSVYADIFLKGTTYNRAYVYQIAGSRWWTLVNSSEASDTTTSDKKTSTEVYTSIAAAGTALHNQAYTQTVAGVDAGHVNSANSATYATLANYVNVVASNEIRFYNDNQFKANNHFWLGYSWADGSHYTPSGGSDTSSTIAPNITKFVMGDCSGGGLTSVHAKTFILGNGSSPTLSSKTTTITTAATTTDRTITLPDDSGTVALTSKTFNVYRGYSVSTATIGYWSAMCNSSQAGSPVLPTSGKWWHVISMDWTNNNTNNWISQLAIATQDGSGVWWRRNNASGTSIDSSSWYRLAEGNSSGAATNIATEVGSAAGARPVFYAYLGDNTRVVYNTNFTYNPSGNVLTASTFDGEITTLAFHNRIYALSQTPSGSTWNGNETLITSIPSASGTSTPNYQRVKTIDFIKDCISDLKEPVLYENTTNPSTSTTIQLPNGIPKYLKVFIGVEYSSDGSTYSDSSACINCIDVDMAHTRHGGFIGYDTPGQAGVGNYLAYCYVNVKQNTGSTTAYTVGISYAKFLNLATSAVVQSVIARIVKIIAVY